MPLYFAYGSNMDSAAMAGRCPGALPLGRARLAGHRFALMADGYATVVPDHQAEVWGLLWRLELADVRPLDAYEEVARGLYRKTIQPVLKSGGGSARALVYIGCAGPDRPGAASLRAPAGYMSAILAAAEALALPAPYRRELERLVASVPESARRTTSEPGTPPPKVRPRFATPFDR